MQIIIKYKMRDNRRKTIKLKIKEKMFEAVKMSINNLHGTHIMSKLSSF